MGNGMRKYLTALTPLVAFAGGAGFRDCSRGTASRASAPNARASLKENDDGCAEIAFVHKH